MSEPSAVRVFFGRALIAVGALVGGLSGLCTGLFLPIFVFGFPSGEFSGRYLPLMFGGPFIGMGGAAFMIGCALVGERRRAWLGWTAVGLGAAIALNAALILGTLTTTQQLTNAWPVLLFDLIPGLILVAAGVFELRRRGPPGPSAEAFD